MLFKLIGIIVVLYLLYGAYLYVTSGSSDIMTVATGPVQVLLGNPPNYSLF